MKLQASGISKFFADIPKNIKTILLYGPDAGLIYERAKIIEKFFQTKAQSQIDILKFSYSEFIAQKRSLGEITNNLSFFANMQIIIFSDMPQTIDKNFELDLKNNNSNIVICLSSELSPSSMLRKSFENNKESMIAIPCYIDNNLNIRKIAVSKLKQQNITFSDDVLDFIISTIKGDRKNILMELDKLVLYIGANNSLSLELAQKSLSASIAGELDDFVSAVLDKKILVANSTLDFLLEKNIQPISIFRALLRHMHRLANAIYQVQAGLTKQEAMSKLEPPVFYMAQKQFLFQMANFNLDQINKIIRLCFEFEKSVKKDGLNLKQKSKRYLLLIIEVCHT